MEEFLSSHCIISGGCDNNGIQYTLSFLLSSLTLTHLISHPSTHPPLGLMSQGGQFFLHPSILPEIKFPSLSLSASGNPSQTQSSQSNLAVSDSQGPVVLWYGQGLGQGNGQVLGPEEVSSSTGTSDSTKTRAIAGRANDRALPIASHRGGDRLGAVITPSQYTIPSQYTSRNVNYQPFLSAHPIAKCWPNFSTHSLTHSSL